MRKKMKITGVLGCMVFGLSLMGGPVLAETNYSSMTNEELAQLRGTMRDAAPEDREAFRAEWRDRVNAMSPEERQNAVGRPANAPRDGAGNRYGRGGEGNRGWTTNGVNRGRGRR